MAKKVLPSPAQPEVGSYAATHLRPTAEESNREKWVCLYDQDRRYIGKLRSTEQKVMDQLHRNGYREPFLTLRRTEQEVELKLYRMTYEDAEFYGITHGGIKNDLGRIGPLPVAGQTSRASRRW